MADLATELSGAAAKRYRIMGSLGVGGMGEVFRGEHIQLGRSVAIKRLKKELAVDQSVITRFENEARAVNMIRHENIVEVTDFFVDDVGRVHMVMELLEGRSLGDLIRAMAPLPPSRVAHIGMQMAEALAAAHQAGIIHRDLKPENVFLISRTSTDDYVKLLDFGIARLHPDCGGLEATESGIVMGTPNYMPPEQAKGRDITTAADTYSLGVILYEMLSGHCPFPRTSAIEMMMAHIADPPRPLESERLPAGFRTLVDSCLAKDPADRPQSMSIIASRLAQWAEVTKDSSARASSSVQSFVNNETKPSFGVPENAGPVDLADGQTWDHSDVSKGPEKKPISERVKFSSNTEPKIVARNKSIVLIVGLIAVAAVVLFVIVRGRNRTSPNDTTGQVASHEVEGGIPKTTAAEDGVEPRAEIDSLLQAMGLPPTPERCKSTDEPELKAHLKAAQYLQDGKPGLVRMADTLALNVLSRLESFSPETHLWKARAHLLHGDSNAAIASAKKAVKGCSDLASGYGTWGTALAFSDNHVAAIETLTIALTIEPTYIDARFNLALSQLANRQPDASIKSLSEVLRLQPELTSARSLRGKVYLQYGDTSKALLDLEMAVLQELDNAKVWYALGFARKKSGNENAATEAFCTAKKLGHPSATCAQAGNGQAPPTNTTEWESDL